MLTIINHPLINHKLTIIRNKNTRHDTFKRNLDEITCLMAYEVFSKLTTKTVKIETPLCSMDGYAIKEDVVILPILRAGMAMVEGMLNAYPQARVGHIGLARDEKNFVANSYYYKMPVNAKKSMIFVVDPMLATGGSAFNTINKLKEEGYENITLVCILSAQEGIDKIAKGFPDIDIFVAVIDPVLTKEKYISPGLGDAGDRFCGTNE